MARQRGPARPAARPAPRPAAAPAQQSRPATTASVPARTAPPPPPAAAPQAQVPQQQGPGLFGQMASTAAGVAVGSSIGHVVGAGISGLFGGSSTAPAEQPAAAAAPAQSQSNNWAASCEADARNFTKCLDDNAGDMQICSWYLEQLKACQNMAKQFN
ncbi:hypothetical protein FN846DRAFT_481350 [Sphaerosporella brunnea]|uniref:CHCH domain-containing protein n=1 Tax=Sphaerosporella brunnea TaxID=1250544 RepID=A0A5J5FAP9_9PEZI|nr:hypothetical protein FN846DRAFT_481350 [Sphaerosporella brunnea]